MKNDFPTPAKLAVTFTEETGPCTIEIRRYPKALTDHNLRREGLWLKCESELGDLQHTKAAPRSIRAAQPDRFIRVRVV